MSDPAPLCLIRRDPARNMARFYRLEITPDLFGGVTLHRQWGRIGTRGQSLQSWFETPEQAEACRDHWAAKKRRRGYEGQGDTGCAGAVRPD